MDIFRHVFIPFFVFTLSKNQVKGEEICGVVASYLFGFSAGYSTIISIYYPTFPPTCSLVYPWCIYVIC